MELQLYNAFCNPLVQQLDAKMIKMLRAVTFKIQPKLNVPGMTPVESNTQLSIKREGVSFIIIFEVIAIGRVSDTLVDWET